MANQIVRTMIESAIKARDRAYAPYSDHPVGAAIRGQSGAIYAGCNVENAAYPLGQCAEAGAIAAMVAGGDRRIAEVVIVGPTEEACMPCGGCRQRLIEFAEVDTAIHICGPDGIRQTLTLGDLLPHSFQLPDKDQTR